MKYSEFTKIVAKAAECNILLHPQVILEMLNLVEDGLCTCTAAPDENPSDSNNLSVNSPQTPIGTSKDNMSNSKVTPKRKSRGSGYADKTCISCGKTFKPASGAAKRCPECAAEWRKHRHHVDSEVDGDARQMAKDFAKYIMDAADIE